eukprot:CAMPEP_0194078940 /NCGR_PEP_ID=MMETSP0149-20130528/5231_1 /TAXON_ID=122233 /ORGANISM="Chaetoceros debilis, Strain MM31A-1" /LENGTH=62 /DNA_ID=CAMNT_0038760297 /DNA_START=810 /DNA_END=998 /DNA_ORIENTATION=-
MSCTTSKIYDHITFLRKMFVAIDSQGAATSTECRKELLYLVHVHVHVHGRVLTTRQPNPEYE